MENAGLGRRDAFALVAGLLAAPGFGPGLAWAQDAPLDKAAFLQASSLATGLEAEKLTGMVDALMAAFRGQGPAVLQLAALARQGAPEDLTAAVKGTPLEPVAKALAAAWYTGTVGSGPGATLISYEDAVAWKAAGYESVPGMCAGEFGVWSDPPPTP